MLHEKLLGIDFGEKRVGLASTDESGLFALPREVLPNDKHLVSKVVRFANENEIKKIVLGESKDFGGNPNPIQGSIEDFRVELENEGFEVVLHPELLTSQEASRLQGEGEMLDASAAALILKSYLDSQSQ